MVSAFAGQQRPESTPQASATVLQQFIAQHSQPLMFDGEEDDQRPVPRRLGTHSAFETDRISRDLKATLHSETYRARLASAWSLLSAWFERTFIGFCCAEILSDATGACIVLCAYIQNLYTTKRRVTEAIEALLATQHKHTHHGQVQEPHGTHRQEASGSPALAFRRAGATRHAHPEWEAAVGVRRAG